MKTNQLIKSTRLRGFYEVSENIVEAQLKLRTSVRIELAKSICISHYQMGINHEYTILLIFFFGDQLTTHHEIKLNKFVPSVNACIMLLKLQINPANIWPIVINTALFIDGVIMPTSTITLIEKTSLFCQIHTLAANATLYARKRRKIAVTGHIYHLLSG
ncbi:hypothetical protein J8655_17070 [Dickeya oryzae]|uniref:hypothetical protein n=1 Tax=Dickeya oryzae TaxID=1240404 RepID=UPI001AEC8070|nr:hypothetical protein [Dickeya oryzae]MBP2847169.1 hypothetical protein [Dickeya oryzae]